MGKFDVLVAKRVEIFKKLYKNGVGLSAKVFVGAWENRQKEIKHCMKKCKKDGKASLEMKGHINDFLVLLLPLITGLSPVYIWD
jgi:hypothetical protein